MENRTGAWSARARRSVIAVVAVASLIAGLIAATSTAGAKASFMSRFSGRVADGWWHEEADLGDTIAYRDGYVSASETRKGAADVWVSVFEIVCPEGVPPYGGPEPVGRNGEPPNQDPCTYGFEEGFASGQPFTMTRKLTAAHLTGSVTLYSYEANGAHEVALDVTWDGEGSLQRERFRYTFHGSNYSESYSSRSQYRQGLLGGAIGDVDLGVVAGSGTMRVFTEMYRSRS